MAGFSIWIALFRTSFFDISGQVLSKEYEIRLGESILINKVWAKDNQNVRSGDTLFSYLPHYQDQKSFYLRSDVNGNNWHNREEMLLKEKIATVRERLKVNMDMLNLQKKKKVQAERFVHLGQWRKERLLPIDQTIKGLEAKISLGKTQLKALGNSLKQLRSNKLRASIKKGKPVDSLPGVIYYLAPYSGKIKQLTATAGQVIPEGENVGVLMSAEENYVKAYLSQDYLVKLKESKTVQIIFPDETVGEGLISNYSPLDVEEEVPQAFEKKLGKAIPLILEILPVERISWLGEDSSEVIVRLKKTGW